MMNIQRYNLLPKKIFDGVPTVAKTNTDTTLYLNISGLIKNRRWNTINIDDLAYTIFFNLKLNHKQKFCFVDLPETLDANFLVFINQIVDLLISRYDLSLNDIEYKNGGWPIPHNIEKYKELCKINNWHEIQMTLTNHFEYIWACNLRVDKIDFTPLEQINKPLIFTCLNGVARIHRIMLFAYLVENDLLNKSIFTIHSPASWYENITNLNEYWAPLVERLVEKINAKEIKLPIKQNISPIEITNIMSQHRILKTDTRIFGNTYFSVINETSYFKRLTAKHTPSDFGNLHLDSAFFTEKTFRAIAHQHPFIMVSRPHSLKYLREAGYETYSPYIDESYDDIEDDMERLKVIGETIKYLCNKDNKRFWERWYYGTRQIALHNYNVLRNKQFNTLSNKIC